MGVISENRFFILSCGLLGFESFKERCRLWKRGWWRSGDWEKPLGKTMIG